MSPTWWTSREVLSIFRRSMDLYKGLQVSYGPYLSLELASPGHFTLVWGSKELLKTILEDLLLGTSSKVPSNTLLHQPLTFFSGFSCRVILVVLWSVRRMGPGIWLGLSPGAAAPALQPAQGSMPALLNFCPSLNPPLLITNTPQWWNSNKSSRTHFALAIFLLLVFHTVSQSCIAAGLLNRFLGCGH